MRKWTYLVAALLMSGTAATFTSCIDTTEPAGIEEMRNAKAELLKAKAAVQTALAAKEQARAEGIKLENAGLEIDNQIAALNLELQQAINEWKKDSLKARRDTLAVSLETKLLELNRLKAEADYELQEALEQININLITMKDDMYARELSYYKALLVGGPYINENGVLDYMNGTGAQTQLATEQTALLSLKMLQIGFEAEKENYKATLETRKAEQEAVLKIHQSLLESVQAIKDASTDNAAEIAEKIAAKENELLALDAEESEMKKKIEEAAGALLPAVNETNKEREKLAKKEIYKINKTDDLAKIANDLYTAVNNANTYFDLGAFEYNNTNYEYELVGDIESKALNMEGRKDGVTYLANQVMSAYGQDFVSAYYTIVGAYPSYPYTNEDGTIKDEHLAKINNELERWAIDTKQVETAYKADEKAWLDAYGAYMAALYTYTNYKNGQNYYDATSKAIEEYNSSTDKTLAKANELRTLVRTYIANREKVDGAVSTATGSFYDNYKDALTDANKAQFDSDIQSLNLGISTISTNYNNGSNENNLLDKFIEATNTFLGTDASSLAECKEPKKVVNGTETTYVVPEGLEPEQGGNSNFEKYLNNIETQKVLENIDTWVALYQTLDKDAQTLTDTYNEINATIDAATTASLDKLEALWKLEVEGFLIKGNNTTEIWKSYTLGIIEYENPYYNIYSTAPILTEAQVIQDQLTALRNMQSGNTINYVYYVENSNEYKVRQGTIDDAIDAIEAQIESKEEQLITTNTLIKLFEEQGFMSENANPDEYPTDYNCGAVLDNSIKAQEDVVKLYEAEVARIEAIINNLLAAMAGE